MKIIINENQLRLIIENEEKKERLLPVTDEMISGGEFFDEILGLYNRYKESKNFVGIRLRGSVDFSGGFRKKVGPGVVEFCNELVEVNGDLKVIDNYVVDFPKLRRVTSEMTLAMTGVRSLPELRYVGRDLTLRVSELPKLEFVGGNLYLNNSQINSLPNLKSVGGSLYLNNSQINSLPKLESVGGVLYLTNTLLSKKTTEEELRKQINVNGEIYL